MLGKALSLAAAGNAGAETDENFNQTVLLLHGDGTNGAQNNTFLDSSTNTFTITRAGNTTQGTFSPFSAPDGRWSNYLDGTSDYFVLSDYNVNFPSGNAWTVEAWLYPTVIDTTNHSWFSTNNPNTFMSLRNTGEARFYNGSSNFDTSGAGITTNQWVHIAITRETDGTLNIWVNGVSKLASTWTGNFGDASNTVWIGGGAFYNDNWFDGYIANLRISDTARYTAPFTPSTTPFANDGNTVLLTCQSNRFVDNSTNNFAITRNGDVKVTPFSPFPITTEYSPSVNGGSGYFDGSGDYLSSAGGGSIGSGEFTIRAWVYPTALSSAYNHVFDTRPNSDATGFSWGVESDGQIFFYSENAFRIQNAGAAGVVPLNSWSHICVTRDSSDNLKAFVNGVQVGSTVSSWTSNYTQTTTLISKYWGGTDHWTGYIADAQMIAGVADSSVPTAPSTNVSGTTLLCNFTNAGIFDNTGFNNLETVADCAINTTTKKYGTGSLSFDGTGDYLFIPPTPDLHLGSGNWTIEFWMYAPDVTTYQDLIGLNFNTNQSSYASVRLVVTSGQFQVLASTTGSSWTTNTTIGSVSTNTWTHVALVRTSSTTLNLFINGVSAGTPAVSGSLYAGAHGSRIANLYWSGNFYYSGFIDDLRITKGVARYTTTFTPPTAAFPNIGE